MSKIMRIQKEYFPVKIFVDFIELKTFFVPFFIPEKSMLMLSSLESFDSFSELSLLLLKVPTPLI
jgi:hypothetical protein